MKIRFSALAAACAAACVPAQAQEVHVAQSPESAPTLAPTVVTATRVAQPLTDVLADVTLIGEEQIRNSGAVNIGDVLARQAGLTMVRNGGPGTTTSMYIRGAEQRFTAVYINGVRVDSQSTGGAPWEAISLDQVERIEIVRGPAAAVYGSDAVAGVVQIFTKRGEGAAFSPYVGVGMGSRRSGKLEAGFSGQQCDIDYAFGAARSTSRGYNARPLPNNPDKDGYRQTSASGNVGWQLNQQHRLEVNGTYTDMDVQYDDFVYDASMPLFDDHTDNRLSTLGAAWIAKWLPEYTMRFSVNESHQRYETRPSPYLTKTSLRGWLLHNEYRWGAHTFTAALERREDKLTNDPIARKRHQNALALGWGFAQGAHTAQLSVRHDRDSEFGGQSTGSASYGYAFAPGWRATVSAGTAFRVPTLYQRFSEYGSPNLQPEKSRNVEVGVRYESGPHNAGVTLHRNRVRNLVTFGAPGPCAGTFGCYESVGSATMRGITISGGTRVNGINLGGSFDWLEPKDNSSGRTLARRARRQLKLNADTRVHTAELDWTLGAEWLAVSSRWNNAANTQKLGGYGVLNLYASATIARDWQALLRFDNITDKSYEHASGYANPGRSVWLGLRWQPRW